jgi:hypothetical protein
LKKPLRLIGYKQEFDLCEEVCVVEIETLWPEELPTAKTGTAFAFVVRHVMVNVKRIFAARSEAVTGG